MHFRTLLKLLLIAALPVSPSYAETLTIAVASNFISPMQAIATQFEQASGHEIRLASSASGKLYAQISAGAPFDLFFSADQDKPQALERIGKTVPHTRFSYAIGRLVLWSALPERQARDARYLIAADYNKLALANPLLAPYGVAAVETLSALKLHASSEPHWVRGENIAQTFQFVESGNAELGFVALSQLIEHPLHRNTPYWIVPQDLHTPILQDAVQLKYSENKVAARAFLDFVKTPEVAELITRFGYARPTAQNETPEAP